MLWTSGWKFTQLVLSASRGTFWLTMHVKQSVLWEDACDYYDYQLILTHEIETKSQLAIPSIWTLKSNVTEEILATKLPWWNLVLHVKGVLRRIVGSDWRFSILSRSHLQSQLTLKSVGIFSWLNWHLQSQLSILKMTSGWLRTPFTRTTKFHQDM